MPQKVSVGNLKKIEILGAIVLGVATGIYIFDQPLKSWAEGVRASQQKSTPPPKSN